LGLNCQPIHTDGISADQTHSVVHEHCQQH